ncbi:DnaA ATPase domain-containing protein [Pseudoroseicyclus aestuarii]|uniref:DnaA protein n=1 Tax=Pseudoroseicyclus aestuarii TaxID=1795041 RepID=A0A318SSZ7_9RHOB|nr:DnaA/Hda family protein [Pseudoroseicyclus aestuarii]PYE85081.1 DnaA protein [Pseudoroseicyclus aestuarii]
MARQLTLPLPPKVAFGADDFFVSSANAAAHAMLLGPAPWPEGKLALVGPSGSGKSHLARVWQTECDARIIDAKDRSALDQQPEAGARLVVEGVEHLPRAAEEPLFHLHNRLARVGGQLLLTSDRAPSRWNIALPDLASRLQATSVVRIEDPDDRLLEAVLAKHFSDRQIPIGPDLLPYLLWRMERSFAAAAEIVAQLDDRALGERRPVTRALARRILEERDG